MQLQLIRHLWGLQSPWEAAFPRIRAEGYAGVETSVPEPSRREWFAELLRTHSLAYVAQTYTDGHSVQEHLESFKHTLDAALELSPILVNCHAGSDAFTERESGLFFESALRRCEGSKVAVAFETHRSRILFTPWNTRRLISEFPELKLCADYSHWVCVCERLLDEADEVFRACAERVLHVHARVGHEQGPQVSDPRAPEFARHLARHEAWWRLIWEAQRRRGLESLTMVPEFGPPGYMPTQPYTGVPLADLEEICLWQAERLKSNFRAFLAESSS